jgi:hypothetical protein
VGLLSREPYLFSGYSLVNLLNIVKLIVCIGTIEFINT